MDLTKMSVEWMRDAMVVLDAKPSSLSFYDELARRLAAESAEITRLRAIVDKLPKTADGVPVGPGELVYTLYGAEWYVQDQNTAAESWMDGDPAGPISECYSTREAAEKAKEQGND